MIHPVISTLFPQPCIGKEDSGTITRTQIPWLSGRWPVERGMLRGGAEAPPLFLMGTSGSVQCDRISIEMNENVSTGFLAIVLPLGMLLIDKNMRLRYITSAK